MGNPYCVLDIANGSSANGANVQIYYSNHSASQKFELDDTKVVVPESTADIDNGKYSVMSKVSTTRGLNVSGDVSVNNANVNIATFRNNVGNCAFYTTKVGKYYQITNAASGNALSVNGVNVVTTNANKADKTQLWSALDNGDSISFVNVATGLYLNVDGGLDKEGQNVNAYKSNGTNSQK